MKYHVIIADQYWRTQFQYWGEKTHQEQLQVVNEEVKRIQQFLEKLEMPLDALCCMTSNHQFTFVPTDVELIPLDGKPHTGVDHIAFERMEQQAKHGYSAAHDDAYTDEQLLKAAQAVLTEDLDQWPADWSTQFFLRATEKGTVGRLAVVGALIAAEIDRVLRAQATAAPLAHDGLPKPGQLCRLRDTLETKMMNAMYPELVGEVCVVSSSRRDDTGIYISIRKETDPEMEPIELPIWALEFLPETNNATPTT